MSGRQKGAVVIGAGLAGTVAAQELADNVSGKGEGSPDGNPQKGSKNDPGSVDSFRGREVTGNNGFPDPSYVQSERVSSASLRDALITSKSVNPLTGEFSDSFKQKNRDSIDADGNWIPGGTAIKEGIVDPSRGGKKASPYDMRPIKGSNASSRPDEVTEATDADVAGNTPISGSSRQSSGSTSSGDWSGGSGGNGGYRGGGGHSGGNGGIWSGGGSSRGFGGSFDSNTFFGPDFMGGRFSGDGSDFHDFLEDLNGDGRFDSRESKAAKKKSGKRGKTLKTARNGKSRKSSLPDLGTNSPIRADILAALEEETGRRHGGWPEGRRYAARSPLE